MIELEAALLMEGWKTHPLPQKRIKIGAQTVLLRALAVHLRAGRRLHVNAKPVAELGIEYACCTRLAGARYKHHRHNKQAQEQILSTLFA